MSRLTKRQAQRHAAAVALLQKDTLTFDERWQVFEGWQESATHINTVAGAFFTPIGLARDFSIEVSGKRVIDLCAGIGVLAFQAYHRDPFGSPPEVVCVERNPDYIAVGRKLLPEAMWIEADAFDLPRDLGRFDCAISNPPFGATRRTGSGPTYTGKAFEYHVIDVAAELADYGVFIIPQESAPFRYSGHPRFEARETDAYRRFAEQTGLALEPNCGIDCSGYLTDWHGVAPSVEIVVADFSARAADAAAGPLFAQVAA